MLQQKSSTHRRARRVGWARDLCLAPHGHAFTVQHKRLLKECTEQGLFEDQVHGEAQEDPDVLQLMLVEELSRLISCTLRQADPQFQRVLTVLHHRARMHDDRYRGQKGSQSSSTWIKFFSTGGFVKPHTTKRCARGMCVEVKQFLSGIRRIARISLAEVPDSQLSAIGGCWIPQLVGTYRMRDLTKSSDSGAYHDGFAQVFGHIVQFIYIITQRERDRWFHRRTAVTAGQATTQCVWFGVLAPRIYATVSG